MNSRRYRLLNLVVSDPHILPRDDEGVSDCNGTADEVERMRKVPFVYSPASRRCFQVIFDTRFGAGGPNS